MNNTDSSKQQALLPCPFCGRKAKVEEFHDGDNDLYPVFSATCEVCPVKTYDQFSAREAARVWNSRASVAAVGGDAAEVVAEKIVAFLFDEYPDNAMDRDGATERIAAIITRHLAATPVVAREVYSELIHIAAELVKSEGFLSPCAEDHSARTPRGIIAAAQYQDSALKNWANRIRQVANRLSAATTSPPETAVGGEPRVCLKCGHEERFSDNEGGKCEKSAWVWDDPIGGICGCFCQFPAPVSAVDDEGEN